MKRLSVLLVAALLSVASSVYAGSTGTITFQGQIVQAQSGQQLTTVQPQTTTASNGSTVTQYAVVSNPTGQTLATFSTLQAANSFASQVTVSVAYRQ
jgi:acyl-CoA thioesterase FadM